MADIRTRLVVGVSGAIGDLRRVLDVKREDI